MKSFCQSVLKCRIEVNISLLTQQNCIILPENVCFHFLIFTNNSTSQYRRQCAVSMCFLYSKNETKQNRQFMHDAGIKHAWWENADSKNRTSTCIDKIRTFGTQINITEQRAPVRSFHSVARWIFFSNAYAKAQQVFMWHNFVFILFILRLSFNWFGLVLAAKYFNTCVSIKSKWFSTICVH